MKNEGPTHCDGCGKNLNPRAANNICAPHTHVHITRDHYQFDDGDVHIDQRLDYCTECMKAHYEWLNTHRARRRLPEWDPTDPNNWKKRKPRRHA